MNNRIETQYDSQTGQVHVSYGTRIQKLFQNCSGKIAEIIDERTFSELCDKMDDFGPRKLASGAILLSRLSRGNSMTASGDEWNWALTLVASTILRIVDSPIPMGDLPIALVALAYIAPVELPDIELPAASHFLSNQSISQEAWNAYEEIRTVENVKLGAVPTVSTASNLWKELRDASCNDPAFHTLLMRLESSSILYRSALEALAKANQLKGENPN